MGSSGGEEQVGAHGIAVPEALVMGPGSDGAFGIFPLLFCFLLIGLLNSGSIPKIRSALSFLSFLDAFAHRHTIPAVLHVHSIPAAVHMHSIPAHVHMC